MRSTSIYFGFSQLYNQVSKRTKIQEDSDIDTDIKQGAKESRGRGTILSTDGDVRRIPIGVKNHLADALMCRFTA